MEKNYTIESDIVEVSGNYAGKKSTVDRARARKTLSLADRIFVIKTFEDKKSMKALADHFKCSLTQIKNIIRRKREYLEQWDNQGDLLEIRRRQSACFMSVGAVVCEWAHRCQSHKLKLTDEILCLRGRQAARLLNAVEVRTTKYWIERIKQKFKIFEPAPDASYKSLEISDIIQDLLPSYSMYATTPQILDPMVIRRYVNESDSSSTTADVNGARFMYQSSESCQSEESSNFKLVFQNHAEQIICDEYKNAKLIAKEDEYLMEVIMPEHEHIMSESEVTIKSEIVENTTDFNAKEVHSYEECLNSLRAVEQFVLLQENIRAIGLLNQLENIFKQEISK